MADRPAAVVSSIYGGYDELCPPAPQPVPVDWVMVTDAPVSCPPWRVVAEPRPWLTPRIASKIPRADPGRYTGADIVIYLDANIVIGEGLVPLLAGALGDAPLMMVPTDDRDYTKTFGWGSCWSGLRDEAAYSATMPKYEGHPIREQAEHYAAAGHPDDWGNWATGLMIRSRDCVNFGDLWLAEIMRWGGECQLALSHVLWQMGLKPASLPLGVWNASGFSRRKHQDGT